MLEELCGPQSIWLGATNLMVYQRSHYQSFFRLKQIKLFTTNTKKFISFFWRNT